MLLVRYTLPGPMTIINTIPNEFYENDEDLARDLAYILRDRVKELVETGRNCFRKNLSRTSRENDVRSESRNYFNDFFSVLP